MKAVRSGAWVALRYLTVVFVLGVVVQFFLVGWGLFGMDAGSTVENAKSLDAHRGLGWILSDFGGILFLVLTLLAWVRPLRIRVLYLVLAVLTFFQGELAAAGVDHRALGMLHPVNALLVLGIAGYLAHYAFARAPEAAPEAAVSPTS